MDVIDRQLLIEIGKTLVAIARVLSKQTDEQGRILQAVIDAAERGIDINGSD